MQDELYENPELVQFYDLQNGWGPDNAFCAALAANCTSMLDLGCGTGRLAAALHEGRDVYGVDPAGAMLEVARAREGGQSVTWVEADARTVRLSRRFDLVVLTGHAFQVFLTDQEQLAVCQTIAAHLAPGGTFVFDSRNPAREEWREWVPETSQDTFPHQGLGQITAWNNVSFDPGTEIATYETFYRAPDGRSWQAASRIRFASRSAISARLAEAGLAATRWLGDWQGGPWTEASREIIPVGGLR